MYEIFSTPTFDRLFIKLSKDTQLRIKEKLKFLAENPGLIKRLSYSPKELLGLCKYRVGDWRILFWVDHAKQTITLYLVDRRDSVYKNL